MSSGLAARVSFGAACSVAVSDTGFLTFCGEDPCLVFLVVSVSLSGLLRFFDSPVALTVPSASSNRTSRVFTFVVHIALPATGRCETCSVVFISDAVAVVLLALFTVSPCPAAAAIDKQRAAGFALVLPFAFDRVDGGSTSIFTIAVPNGLSSRVPVGGSPFVRVEADSITAVGFEPPESRPGPEGPLLRLISRALKTGKLIQLAETADRCGIPFNVQ
jgi:hypothetical protein